MRLKGKVFPDQVFVALLWSDKHFLIAIRKNYKGFRFARAYEKNYVRLYLGWVELEYNKGRRWK